MARQSNDPRIDLMLGDFMALLESAERKAKTLPYAPGTYRVWGENKGYALQQYTLKLDGTAYWKRVSWSRDLNMIRGDLTLLAKSGPVYLLDSKGNVSPFKAPNK